MKLSLLPWILVGLAISISCGEREIEPPYTVTLIGLTEKGDTFEEKNVTLKTLTNAKTMHGTRCEVRVGSRLEISKNSTIDSLAYTDGNPVSPEFTVKDGIIKPSNLLSSLAFGSYFAFEEVSQFWVDSFDLNMEEFGKIRILLDPTVKIHEENSETRMRTNAFYYSIGTVFGVLPPAGEEFFPIPLNKAIIAHEFTHGVFDLIVFKRNLDIKLRGLTADQWNVNGLNEGLADYFSHVVTNTTNIGEAYIDQASASRALPVGWRSKRAADSSTVTLEKLPGDFYAKGSVLASALWEIEQRTDQSPVTVGKQVFAAMKAFAPVWQQGNWINSFDFYHFINLVLDQAPQNLRSTYCGVFSYWFNDEINNLEIRNKCAAF